MSSLRARRLGTIVGAVVLVFAISIIAAKLTLQSDLNKLGKTEVAGGASAFAGYWNARKEQIRLLIVQDAMGDALRKSLQTGGTRALAAQLANLAQASGLSFLTVVDQRGVVVARSNGAGNENASDDPYLRRALTGETVSTAALLSPQELAREGLASQAEADVTNASGSSVEHVDRGLALIAAAPISDANERTIGAIYGGVLMNHFYDLVDQSAAALGGQTALLEGDAIVASTLSRSDGTRVVDAQDFNAPRAEQAADPYIGSDSQGGTQYLAQINPILDDRNRMVGAYWYGVPMARISAISNHLIETFAFWGVIAMLAALALAIPLAQRLSAAIALRSSQISVAAKELGVTIDGGEVSGDHVAATKVTVERAGAAIDEIERGGATPQRIAELKSLNTELEGDITVIDTLSQEMSTRLQQAVRRVAELNGVAGGLDALVHGARP